MATGFQYNYTPLTYANAQKQVQGQIDPLYNRAVEGLKQQQYQNNLQAGNVAAARGLGHSGLAADQLNKIAIATQGQIGDLNAQRATQLAQMANDLLQQDRQFNLQNRGQLFNEYASNRDYNYGVGRDKIADTQWQKQFDYTKAQDTLANQWKQKEWSQLSPAEKARAAMEYSYSQKLKGSSGGGGGGGSSSRGRSSSSYYANPSSTGVTAKNSALNIDPRILEQYYKAELQKKNREATVPWGTSSYYKKMKNLQY